MEQEIALILPKARREAHNPDLADALGRHLDETREHARRLERGLDLLGEHAGRPASPAIDGLRLQHESFAGEAAEDVTPDVLDLELMASAVAIEHNEIAAYESLIALADANDQPQIGAILRENLADEQRMLTEGRRMAQIIGTAATRAR
jgi:ferritin-like metal-binding protein YciE